MTRGFFITLEGPEGSGKSTQLKRLAHVLRRVGYDVVGTQRVAFTVDDSARPAGSAQPLEQHLARVPGVLAASFNLAAAEVRVDYVPGVVDRGTLRRAVEEFGYETREAPGQGDAAVPGRHPVRPGRPLDLREV